MEPRSVEPGFHGAGAESLAGFLSPMVTVLLDAAGMR
jgi:hypothetical protein